MFKQIALFLILFTAAALAADSSNYANNSSNATLLKQSGTGGASQAMFEFRSLIILLVVLTYLFASGRIADFFQSGGKWVSKKEVLLAPLAFMAFASFAIIAYFLSPYSALPQDTIVTKLIYLLVIPLTLATGAGVFVLMLFFHDRLNMLQALDLSVKIVFAPVFDGLQGYWTAINVVFILGVLSTIAFYSSGGNFSLVTMDFLLLSIIASLYFIYRGLTAVGNESKASALITAFILIAPSIMRFYFKDLVCAGLALLPFNMFSPCPLNTVGSEITLVISVLATLVILIPVIPVAYAVMVNVLRFLTVAEVLVRKAPRTGR